MQYFTNRSDAGKHLVSLLLKYRNTAGLVLAVPRGGVPVASEVAKKLSLPLEVVLVKKIGHPHNKEYAIGAVSLTSHYVIPHDDVSEEYVRQELKTIRSRLTEMQQLFCAEKEPVNLAGKTVIVVDDGVATGNTLIATIRMLRQGNPAKLVVAVPVASRSAYRRLLLAADELLVLQVPNVFPGVGAFYKDFRQVTDDEVKHCLHQIQHRHKAVLHPDHE